MISDELTEFSPPADCDNLRTPRRKDQTDIRVTESQIFNARNVKQWTVSDKRQQARRHKVTP
jgi:hypothetical protein